MNEAELVADYRRIEEEQRLAIDALSNHFRPLVKAALRNDDEKGAMDLIRRCPCVIVNAFSLDLVRTYKLEGKNSPKLQ